MKSKNKPEKGKWVGLRSPFICMQFLNKKEISCNRTALRFRWFSVCRSAGPLTFQHLQPLSSWDRSASENDGRRGGGCKGDGFFFFPMDLGICPNHDVFMDKTIFVCESWNCRNQILRQFLEDTFKESMNLEIISTASRKWWSNVCFGSCTNTGDECIIKF